MAFLASGINQLAVSIDGLNWWDYRTADTIATVEGAGYFNNYAPYFNLYDKLLVTASDDLQWYYVSAIDTPVDYKGVVDNSPAANTVTITRLNPPSSSVTNAMLANMAASTIKGRAVGAGTGSPTDLTAAQAAAVIGTVGGALLSKVISFTRDMTAASGNVAYTGVGFQPTTIIFFGIVAAAFPQFSTGFADSAKSGKTILCYGNNVMSTTGSSPIALFDTDGTGTKSQAATINSYDSDGFTLAWTKTLAPAANTATIYALCYR